MSTQSAGRSSRPRSARSARPASTSSGPWARGSRSAVGGAAARSRSAASAYSGRRSSSHAVTKSTASRIRSASAAAPRSGRRRAPPAHRARRPRPPRRPGPPRPPRRAPSAGDPMRCAATQASASPVSGAKKCTCSMSTCRRTGRPAWTPDCGDRRAVIVRLARGHLEVDVDVLERRDRLGVELGVHQQVGAQRLGQRDRQLQRAGPVPVRRAGELEHLRPDPDHDLFVHPAGERGMGRQQGVGHAQPLGAEQDLDAPGAVRQPAAQEVHRRRADEARHEHVGRLVVELLRRADLLQPAVAHDRDAVAHRHRLGLVVGDVQRRRPELLVQARDVRAHLDAQLGVEVRQRLVHQERLRARARSRAPARRAGAGRRTARAGGARAARRCPGATPRPPTRSRIDGLDLPLHLQREAHVRRPRSCAGRARRTGTPSRCRGPWARCR